MTISSSAAPAGHVPSSASRIRHARLVDGLHPSPLDDVAVEIVGGFVTSVTADPCNGVGVGELDASGCTVLPGFINLHSHLLRRVRADDPPKMTVIAEASRALRNAREALAQGITTARELGARDYMDLQLRDLIDSGSVPGPRILASGRPITRTGGHNCDFGIEADGCDEVRKAARANLKAGADVLKVMASWGGIETLQAHRRRQLPGSPPPAAAAYTVAEMRTAVEEAHANGVRVTVHAESSESIRNAIAAGVDSIEHGTHLTGDVIALLADTGTTLVPTISTAYRRAADADAGGGPGWHPDVIAWARAAAAPWMDGLRRAVAAGVTIATGTDAGGDMATEISLLAEAGLSPAGALRSGTSVAAKALGRDDIGAIEVGRRADMVIVRGAPDIDVGDLEKISYVVRDGVPYQPGGLLREGTAPAFTSAARDMADRR